VLVPIPDLSAARRVLCIQPHYDDNDIGAGGTLAALAARGTELVYVTATDDLLGVREDWAESEARENLKAEQRRAGELIGVKEQRWLEFPDGGEYDYFALRRALVAEIRRFRPDFVLTCDPFAPYEAHSDHVRVGKAAAEAVLFHRFPRFRTQSEVDAQYEPYDLTGIAFYFSAAPNLYVEIDAARERKHAALDAYAAQFSAPELQLLHAALEIKERGWAAAADQGFAHAEAFKLLSPIHLHVSPDVEEVSRNQDRRVIAWDRAPAS